jgi:hypothetical protein
VFADSIDSTEQDKPRIQVVKNQTPKSRLVKQMTSISAIRMTPINKLKLIAITDHKA